MVPRQESVPYSWLSKGDSQVFGLKATSLDYEEKQKEAASASGGGGGGRGRTKNSGMKNLEIIQKA